MTNLEVELSAKLQVSDNENARLRAALEELVAVFALKSAAVVVRSDPYYITHADTLDAEYDRRFPAAVDAAMMELGAKAMQDRHDALSRIAPVLLDVPHECKHEENGVFGA